MFQRTRWSAVGAALAVVLGAGVALPNASAAVTSGERAVFVPIVPCRLFDTRPAPDNIGPRATPLGAGEVYTQQVGGTNGHCNIPTDATAISMNVTAVGGTAGSFLTLYPADAAERPQASNLNWTPGSPAVPNKVDVKLSANRAINLFNLAGSVDVLADVVGYYADHNHDDRYFTKTESETQLATKANTADVYTKTQINSLPSSSVIAGGVVNSDGTVSTFFPRFGSAWTVAKVGTGAYQITFLALHPACANIMEPLMLVSGLEFSPGSEREVSFTSTTCANGNTTVQVQAYNGAGATSDRGFQFIAYRPGNNQIAPTAAPPPGATECTRDATGTLTCV